VSTNAQAHKGLWHSVFYFGTQQRPIILAAKMESQCSEEINQMTNFMKLIFESE